MCGSSVAEAVAEGHGACVCLGVCGHCNIFDVGVDVTVFVVCEHCFGCEWRVGI